jgi:NTE family protein
VEQQMPFVGINNLSAMKNILTVFRTDYRFRLAKNHYMTGILNYARDCDRFDGYTQGLGYFGAAVQYSYDTIFGPMTFNVHWSDLTQKVGIYFSVGYNF